MDVPEGDGFNWLFDLSRLDDIPLSCGNNLFLDPPFQWPSNALSPPAPPSVGHDQSCSNFEVLKECNSKKRARSGACSGADSKSRKEKMRRDRLNDQFLELSSVLDPGRPPKTDKSVILSDAVRVIHQLRDESRKLKESFENLQEQVIDLKAEKNELRDEKQKLKTEREKLEQQLKASSSHPGVLPYPLPTGHQMVGSKMVPFVAYPGIQMVHFVPSIHTSKGDPPLSPVA
ncbi:unnamed protein product [Cuscuta europaea]|uniref:BHLH domain-containing protein n=1 Tax=Cuscuta europaea TaxID=41803 RepID=A0A9P1E5U1_CUSEU|nr:unnamed protein product [Cuscuta europaea]